jgi:hypothetical protein
MDSVHKVKKYHNWCLPMFLTVKYNKRVESAFSMLLLLVLAVIGAGILIRQNDTDMSRFGVNLTADNPSGQSSSKSPKKSVLDAVVPEGYTTQTATETYNVDNLYEKIDGKAPLYIDSGCVELSAQRFVSKKDENLSMEIELFDMGNFRNAFSILSVQRRPDANNLSIFNSAFGYKTSNALYFIHGKYYIELVGSSVSSELSTPMISTAGKLMTLLAADKAADIPQLSLFMPENLVEGTIKLYLKNAFGFDGLSDVFAGRYKINNESITAFLSEYPDAKTAQAKSDSYYKFLIENGAKELAASNQILKNNQAKIVDFYGTTEIVFATGVFIGGIHEAANRQAAENLAAGLFENLSKQPTKE